MVSLDDIENFENKISSPDSESNRIDGNIEQEGEILEKIEDGIIRSIAERIHNNDDLLERFSEKGSEDSKNKYAKMFRTLFNPAEFYFLSDDLGESEEDVSTQISIGNISTTSGDGLGIRISYSVLPQNTTLPSIGILSAHGQNGPIGVGGVVLSENSYWEIVRNAYKDEPSSVNNMVNNMMEHLKFVNMWKFIFYLECERKGRMEERGRRKLVERLLAELDRDIF